MKKLGVLMCMLVSVAMLLGSTSEVNAITHKVGCAATAKKITCGSLIGTAPAGSHQLYITANGTVVTCNKRDEMHFHTITCAGCGALYASNEMRTCRQLHDYCPSVEHMCQY